MHFRHGTSSTTALLLLLCLPLTSSFSSIDHRIIWWSSACASAIDSGPRYSPRPLVSGATGSPRRWNRHTSAWNWALRTLLQGVEPVRIDINQFNGLMDRWMGECIWAFGGVKERICSLDFRIFSLKYLSS